MADTRDDDGGMPFFELGAFRTPLQALRAEYAEDPTAVSIIEAAERLALVDSVRAEAVETERLRIRRLAIDPQLIDELGDRAQQAGEESYAAEHALNEVLQAAAVGSGSVILRNLRSISLAVSAKQLKQIGRARDAYTDVNEGLEILDRVFQGLPGLDDARETVRRGWEAVKAQSPAGLDLFDPDGDPATCWQQLLLWNTDTGPSHGILSQCDATMRLALHFEHWVDRRGGTLDAPARAMIEQCAAPDSPDALLAARLFVTIGDALLEVAAWSLAAEAFARAQGVLAEEGHPVRLHAAIQEAFAWLMLGNPEACRQRLDRIDEGRLESMSRLVLTVAAETARYRALEAACSRRGGATPARDVSDRVQDHLRALAAIFSPHPQNRTEYLRSLYFALTARDVETMMRS